MNHTYLRCTLAATGHCSGCRDGESSLDCKYEALGICSVCGGMEGSLLPTCPGRWLTREEDEANYKHYCEGTGPFACRICGKPTGGFDEKGKICIDCALIEALRDGR